MFYGQSLCFRLGMRKTDKRQNPASDQKIKVLHLTTSLSAGAAEMMLYKLISNTDRTKFEPIVVSLMEGGRLKSLIEDLGIAVFSLEIGRGKPSITGFIRLYNLFKKNSARYCSKPDISLKYCSFNRCFHNSKKEKSRLEYSAFFGRY
jgi:hypothetical protein